MKKGDGLSWLMMLSSDGFSVTGVTFQVVISMSWFSSNCKGCIWSLCHGNITALRWIN